MSDTNEHVRGRLGLSTRSTSRSDTRETAPTGAGQRLVRTRRGSVDPFYIPPELIPEGMSWEWKRESNVGQEDKPYMSALMQNHWEPVDVKQVGNLAPAGATGPYRYGGQILMQRPAYLTEEALNEDYERSVGRARELERQMGVTNPGEAPRFTGKNGKGGSAVTRSVENMVRVPIPE